MKTMICKAVIFDLDGTILDTLDDLTDSVNFALLKNNLPLRTVEEIRTFVGNGVKNLIQRSLPDDNKTSFDAVFSSFAAYYAEHCNCKTKAYLGIIDVIIALREKGIKTAVVSNKSDKEVKKLCAQYFDGLFEVAIGEREGIRRKPYPDSVNESLKILGVSANEAVYVGDSEVDLLTAKNADVKCVSVTWGFRSKQFLISCGADNLIDSPSEILSAVTEK